MIRRDRTTEAQVEMMRPQAKQHLNHQKLEEAEKRTSPAALGASRALPMYEFWPLEPQSKFPSSQATSLW